MASMTDVIFLLLIFFMISSTVVMPNAIKVTLPQSANQTPDKPQVHLVIDRNLKYTIKIGSKEKKLASFDDIATELQSLKEKNKEDFFVGLAADENVEYKEVVRVLNIANENKFKMVLVTRPPKK
jgi:biopolymer transport protein ExbD